MTQRTWLVTGGCGFIGSNFIEQTIETREEVSVVNLDALTYAGHLANTATFADSPRYHFEHGSIADAAFVERVVAEHKPDVIVNFAAESHVDRSIDDASPFMTTNVLGTQILLEAALRHELATYVQVSTDEVYGSLGETGSFTESTPLQPNSPYSASKTAADCFVRAYHETHGMDARITRCSNNYGPRQFPEKLIPLFLKRALHDERLPVYGDGTNVRDWIYVADHVAGILAVVERGRAGEVYNFGGDSELSNLELTKTLLNSLGKPESLIEFVEDRKGHDFRYAIDHTKATEELGWNPTVDFETGLERTIAWYRDNEAWLAEVSE